MPTAGGLKKWPSEWDIENCYIILIHIIFQKERELEYIIASEALTAHTRREIVYIVERVYG